MEASKLSINYVLRQPIFCSVNIAIHLFSSLYHCMYCIYVLYVTTAIFGYSTMPTIYYFLMMIIIEKLLIIVGRTK